MGVPLIVYLVSMQGQADNLAETMATSDALRIPGMSEFVVLVGAVGEQTLHDLEAMSISRIQVVDLRGE